MGTTIVDEPTAMALGISLRAQMGEGRELVFQTHIPRDTEAAAIDTLIDKLHSVAQRQLAVAEIELLKRECLINERQATQIRNDRQDVLAKAEMEWSTSDTRRGPWDEGKLPAQLKSAVSNHNVSIARYLERNTANRERIKELEGWLSQLRKS